MTAEQHLTRAMQAQQQGRPADVAREIEAALRLRPDHPAALNMLGMEAMRRNDVPAARKHFEAATRADPSAAALWLNLAKVHRLSGDDSAERAALESALETDQRSLMGLIRIAELHERRGELGDAAIRWAGVVALSAEHVSAPADLRAIFDHARAFLTERKQQLAEALEAELATDLNNNLAWSALHLWKDGERIEGACARAPKTAAIVEQLPLAHIPGRAPTAFFSILRAGKHIPPHTGVTNTRAIIHLPLVVPPGCAFRVGGETRDWVEGQAFAFDDTIEHEAWNRSDQDRAVLILDTWNPHLSEHERAMICRLFDSADAQKNR
jgi:hypothetical protein